MQNLGTETASAMRHAKVRRLSGEQLSRLSIRDFEELKIEYAELVATAEARIAEVKCARPWPIGRQFELSDWQTEQIEQASRQSDAAEHELMRISQELAPELW